MKDVWNEKIYVKKTRIKKIIVLIFVAILIIGTTIVSTLYFTNTSFREWTDLHIFQKETHKDDVAVINFNSDANAEICAYDKYIGILSKNKFQIYNSCGKEENNIDIPINNVIFSNSGRFLGIAENSGNNIYMISGQSLMWDNKVEGSIFKIRHQKWRVIRLSFSIIHLTFNDYASIFA